MIINRIVTHANAPFLFAVTNDGDEYPLPLLKSATVEDRREWVQKVHANGVVFDSRALDDVFGQRS